MTISERLLVVIDADTKGAIREIDALGKKADKSLSSTQSKMDKFANTSLKYGAGLVGVSAIAAVGLTKAAQGASHLSEAINKNNVVFERSGDSVVKWSKGLAKSFGLSQSAALDATGAFGAMFRTTGLAAKPAADMSKKMVELAADMASFSDEDPSAMLERLRSGLAGEAEPLRRFGVLLSEAGVKAYAYKNGIAATGQELTEAQKVQARYGVILEQSVLQQGDYERTAGSAANKQRSLTAELKNASDEVGKSFLPIMSGAIGVLSGLAGGFNDLNDSSNGAVGKFATFGTIAAGTVGTVGLIAGGVIKLKGALDAAAVSAPRLTGALKGIGAGAGIIGLSITVGQAIQELRSGPSIAEKVEQQLGESTKKLVKHYTDAAGKLKKLDMFSGVARKFDSDAAEFAELAKRDVGAAQRLYEALDKNRQSSIDAGIPMGKFNKILDEQSGKQKQLAADAERGAGAVAKHGKASKDAAASVEELTKKIDAQRVAMLASFDSEIGAAQAIQSLAETLKTSNDPLEKQAALLSTAGAKAQFAADQYETLTGKTATASQKQEYMRNALIELATKFPELGGMVLGYVARLNEIPPSKTTSAKFDYTSAEASVQEWLRRLARVPQAPGGPGGSGARYGKDPEFATGGPIPGSPGEKVRVVAHGGEYVLSADVVRRIKQGRASQGADTSSSGASGTTGSGTTGSGQVIINVNSLVADANTGRQVARALAAYQRNGGQ